MNEWMKLLFNSKHNYWSRRIKAIIVIVIPVLFNQLAHDCEYSTGQTIKETSTIIYIQGEQKTDVSWCAILSQIEK